MAGTCGGNGTSAAVFHHSELHLLTHFSSCCFLCFSLQIFRHSEVHHWEKCYWWLIPHNCLVFSCICACVLIGFCKKMYIVLQFCIGVFAFCPKLPFGKIFVGKLQGTTMKKRVCDKSSKFEIIFNPHIRARKLQILYCYLILVASCLLRWEKPLRVAVDDIKHSESSVVLCAVRGNHQRFSVLTLSQSNSSIRVDENGAA